MRPVRRIPPSLRAPLLLVLALLLAGESRLSFIPTEKPLIAQSSVPVLRQLTAFRQLDGRRPNRPVVSPDGRHVAFIVEPALEGANPDVQVFVVPTTGLSLPMPVTGTGMTIRRADPEAGVSVGVNQLTFIGCQKPCDLGRSGNLYVADFNGTPPSALVSGIQTRPLQLPLFSADGSTIAFSNFDRSLFADRYYLIGSDGQGQQEIVPVSTLNADATRIGRLGISQGPPGGLTYKVMTSDPLGASLQVASQWDVFAGSFFSLDVSGDGLVVVHTRGSAWPDPGLHLNKIDGTQLAYFDADKVDIATTNYDGSLVAFQHTLSRGDIFLWNSQNQAVLNLSNTPDEIDANGFPVASLSPSISEDGSVVTFLSTADLVPGSNPDRVPQVFVSVLAEKTELSLNAISPVSGPVTGGTSLTIAGSGFVPGATVSIGGMQATNVTVVDPQTITAVSGSHVAGVVDVVVANSSGASAKLEGAFTYTTVPTANTLEGLIGFWDGEFWPLDGAGVEITQVQAMLANGVPLNATSIGKGQFRFENLSSGQYDLAITIRYQETIQNNIQACGLVLVGNGGASLHKTTQVVVPYSHSVSAVIKVRIPPPVVLLHGIAFSILGSVDLGGGSFERWFDSESISTSQKWDDALRRSGFITLTPNYRSLTADRWNDSVSSLSFHVTTHLRLLTSKASTTQLPRWTMVAHSQGGLVTRAMLWSLSSTNPLRAALGQVFLLGTPNSGAANTVLASLACVGYLSVENMTTSFNKRNPTFRNKPTLAFAGTALTYNHPVLGPVAFDGLVIEDSVYNIYTSKGLSQQLDQVPDLEMDYTHQELGAPPSVSILTSQIVPLLGSVEVQAQ